MRTKGGEFPPQVQRLRDLVNEIQKARPSLDNKKMAKQLGYSSVNFSRVLNAKRGISDRFIQRFCREYDVDPDYLRMITDEPWRSRKAPTGQEQTPKERDESIPRDIKMAIEVLESGTDFAVSLRKSIHSLHDAITMQHEYASLLQNLGAKNTELENRIAHLEQMVRDLSPPPNFPGSPGLAKGSRGPGQRQKKSGNASPSE